MRWFTALLFASFLMACNGDGKDDDTPDPDADGDGYKASVDCDDNDENINPEADEICDEVDNDCDGEVDEEAIDMMTFYLDGDTDGYGDPNTSVLACVAPEGHVEIEGDCDDADIAINPDATEVCDELGEIDEDCDGLIDDADDSLDTTTQTSWYEDADVDGFGSAAATAVVSCQDPSDATTIYWADNTDCDDSRDDVYPGAEEVCDELDTDENCDGLADNDAPDNDVDTQTWWYVDADMDLYGDLADLGELYCDDPSDAYNWFSMDDTDCDDTRADVNPGADEVCDVADVDEDCDGFSDDDDSDTMPMTMTKYHEDADKDGYGAEGRGTSYCDDPSTSSDWWTLDNTDCDDAVASTNPGATEATGDGVDSDCDGGEICYVDADDDGYVANKTGTVTSTDEDCDDSGEGTAAEAALDVDCDDSVTAINPGATEVCDAADTDENCNGLADDADSGVDTSTQTTYYVDADKDGYGDSSATGTGYCDDPSDATTWYASTNTDCDDGDDAIRPGAAELCGDGIDNDCDATTTESGLASFVDDTTGAFTDITSSVSGSAAAPASYTASSAGDLIFCDGTFYTNITVEADVWIEGMDGTEILDGGSNGTVVNIQTDGLTVDVYDVTIQNGNGTGTVGGAGYDTGGGINCEGTAELYIDGVTLTANTADLGGGLAVKGCDVDISDSTFSDNTATYGAGLFFLENAASISDSLFDANVAVYGGGGLYLWDDTDVIATDTMVTDNDAGYSGGGARMYDNAGAVGMSFVFETTVGGSGGFTGNTAGSGGGGAVQLGQASTSSNPIHFDVVNSDFGTSAGGDDNDSNEIKTDGSGVYNPGDGVSFRCDVDSCGSSELYTVGETSSTSSANNVYKGNAFLAAESNAKLAAFQQYLGPASTCLLDYYVLSNTSATTPSSGATWTVEWRSIGNSVSSSTIAYQTVADIDIELEVGTYYALVTGFRCSGGTVSYAYGRTNDDGGFGDQVLSINGSGYTTPWTTTATLSAYSSSSAARYRMKVDNIAPWTTWGL